MIWAKLVARSDRELHWTLILNEDWRPHMTWARLARAHIWEVWCFYVERFELKNLLGV